MKTLVAPDWRNANPYQQLLADALAQRGCAIDFLSHYRRGLPLARGVRDFEADVLHLHWPEAYYLRGSRGGDRLRQLRFPIDLALAHRHLPLVLTAHNLYPHDRGDDPLIRHCARNAYRAADAIIALSDGTAALLAKTFSVDPGRISVIPHGDLSVRLGAPVPRAEARRALGLGDGRICLMFGVLQPYKGTEETIAWWKTHRPEARLVLVGKPIPDTYADELRRLAGDDPLVDLRAGWADDRTLALWLSAADCAAFNYRRIFISGAATLARSWGLPILFPAHLDTVDLGEPDPRVLHFSSLETDFASALERALQLGPDHAAAAGWRARTAWPEIARATEEVYCRASEVRLGPREM